jgi:hypothetical protein
MTAVTLEEELTPTSSDTHEEIEGINPLFLFSAD